MIEGSSEFTHHIKTMNAKEVFCYEFCSISLCHLR